MKLSVLATTRFLLVLFAPPFLGQSCAYKSFDAATLKLSPQDAAQTSLSEKTAMHFTANTDSCDMTFEVASIKPNRAAQGPPAQVSIPDGVRVVGDTTAGILLTAFFGDYFQTQRASIKNAPAWVANERYDITARVAAKDLKAWQSEPNRRDFSCIKSAFRALLEDRFNLRAHVVESPIPYISIVSRRGQRKQGALSPVHEIPPRREGSHNCNSGGNYILTRDQQNMRWSFSGCSIDDLAFLTELVTGRPAQNKTGIKGIYNFEITVNRRELWEDPLSIAGQLARLGLGLQSDKGPGYTLIIEHIDRPSPD